MVTQKKTYLCDVCHTEYDNKTQARTCEKSGFDYKPISVGAVFLISPGRGNINFLPERELFDFAPLSKHFLITLDTHIKQNGQMHTREYDFLRVSSNILNKEGIPQYALNGSNFFGIAYHISESKIREYFSEFRLHLLGNEEFSQFKERAKQLISPEKKLVILGQPWAGLQHHTSIEFPNPLLPSVDSLTNPRLEDIFKN